MAELDDYVRSIVDPNLVPGEVVKAIGVGQHFTKHNLVGNPEGLGTTYLVTATDRRLILIKTKEKLAMATVNAAASNLGIDVWWYCDLQAVQTKWYGGLLMATAIILAPREGLGPREGKGMRLYLKKKAQRLDAPEALAMGFPPWLQQNVEAQLFDKNGLVAGAASALQAHTQRKAAYPPVPKRSKAPIGLGCLGLLMFLGVFLGLNYASFGERGVQRAESSQEALRARALLEDARGEPETAAQTRGYIHDREDDEDRAQANVYKGYGFSCLCTLLALGMLAGAVVLFLKTKKKYDGQVAERNAAVAQIDAGHGPAPAVGAPPAGPPPGAPPPAGPPPGAPPPTA